MFEMKKIRSLKSIFLSIFFGGKSSLKCAFGLELKIKIISLFSLVLLLFIGPTTFFGTIYKPHCIILTNFYFYLQYF